MAGTKRNLKNCARRPLSRAFLFLSSRGSLIEPERFPPFLLSFCARLGPTIRPSSWSSSANWRCLSAWSRNASPMWRCSVISCSRTRRAHAIVAEWDGRAGGFCALFLQFLHLRRPAGALSRRPVRAPGLSPQRHRERPCFRLGEKSRRRKDAGASNGRFSTGTRTPSPFIAGWAPKPMDEWMIAAPQGEALQPSGQSSPDRPSCRR